MSRPKTPLNEEVFRRLFSLAQKQPWTIYKVKELDSLNSECESQEELALVLDLIERFNFLDGQRIEDCTHAIANIVDNNWNLNPNSTIITHKSLEKTDSSSAVLYQIRTAFARSNKQWAQNKFSTNLRRSLEADRSVRNVVLVDDFSGTGDSLEKFASWLQRHLDSKGRDIKLFACFYCAMEATIQKSYCAPIEKIHTCLILKKGITDFYGSLAAEMISTMINIERRLSIPDLYSLGYKRSEALYAAQSFNIPNNNFPIFWHSRKPNGSSRYALFPRAH